MGNYCHYLEFDVLFKGSGFTVQDESRMACVILWIALVIFMVASLSERNVVYGAVWLWAVQAINYENQMKDIFIKCFAFVDSGFDFE